MMNVGLIGCGHISETYFRSQKYFNNINIIACSDLNSEAAKQCSEIYKIESKTVDDILNDKKIDIILNLTNVQSHFETIKKTLLAGKHSYCEKPLSITFEQGKELYELAKKNNLYLGNAPDTFLGGGGQKTRSIIDSGDVGKIILGNFIFAFPGVEPWHPSPEPWFQKGGGPVIDMGPYFFTMLVHLLGPAKSVNSQATKITDYRVIGSGQKKGKKFDVEIPTSYMITLTFQNNSIMHGFLSFDVLNHNRNHMEFYGTKGSIIGPDPNMFGGPILASFSEGGQWQEFSTEDMPLGKTNIFSQSSRSNESPKNANYRGIGLSEMIFCIENKKIHRCNGDLSLHVLDIIDSTILSAQTSEEKEMRTTCTRPDYFSDEEIKKLLK